MARYRGFAEAHKRAENIIINNLYKAWKPIREATIKEVVDGDIAFYDIDVLSGVLFKGLLIAYIFGRVYGYGYLNNLVKRNKSKLESRFTLAEFPSAEQVLYLVYNQNKDVLKLMLSVNAFKRLTKDMFAEYFRPSSEALNFLRGYTVSLAKVEEVATRKEVTRLVAETIKEGLSEEEAILVLKNKVKQFTTNRIQMIARTEATRAFNLGNLQETYMSEVIIGYRYVAVLDDRTTKMCKSRHGKFIPKDDIGVLAMNTPPLHVNCRSFLEPVSGFRKEIPEKLNSGEVESGMQRQEDIELVYGFLKNAK
jgi:SPP1 gp7 family putative phage head morphogenesis protein